jgi:hypothetical protein
MAAISPSTSAAPCPCHRCLCSACGTKAKVCRPVGLPRDVDDLLMQVEVTVDSEISLWLPPCVASRIARIAKQQRLQGMWTQKRRWFRLVEGCSHGRHECKVIVLCRCLTRMPQVLELQIDCVFKDVKKQGARDCSCERVTCIVIVRSLIVIWVTDVFDGLPNLQLLEWLERRQGACRCVLQLCVGCILIV